MPTLSITARRRPEPGGFTLLEVLLVLGILGLVAALISVRLDTMLPSFRIKAAARELASTVAWVRSESIASGKPMAIRYDLQGGQYWVATTDAAGTIPAQPEPPGTRFRQQELPDGVRFEDISLFGVRPSAARVVSIPFTWLGACEGHWIHLGDADGAEMTVEVLPLGAQVNLYDSREEPPNAATP